MTILAIDTSNDALGIALYQNEQVIEEYISVNKNKHSARLMPAVDQLLKNAEVKPEDLSKIVVAKGPGSYTGVRIGLSVAKAMAWSLKIPIVGISSLEILSLQAQGRGYSVCPFIDARRDLVFTGLYDSNGQIVINDQNILMVDWLDKLAEISKKIIFVSPDLKQFEDMIIEKLGEKAIFMPKGFHVTRPGLLALAGKKRPGEDVHQLVPSYLRLVEAEAKWLAEQEGKQDG
ncbi:tRNA (adenosine(37)-N6)-threonylcarbamoyltransferase complex dimerization subunit type 1 TsaB [Amphibacillus sp. MSJ-3]|uniref:tRNA (adenosine(37)-N6)-threonylcarbamoyltransferase complex dimerization subunit type 1 TsaB n=1 Tax=Amphibacillus sp. MSJ-3 TaxID=2841505 RepID=UPI001C0ED002|nr:tRNA (adenosine(37)-N6)-threonylcarbamoyltransferase complex dimerization subunit type 1 TsaB [Amphibacillus sp. MSJ-3]MBU5595350.1 tRNA (adenosine(37)-N6)-threonylcarbamoyltransferase complex dimerization subunit type 1 TsaB [Amphibacillus sp. MSJ-3]